MRGSSLTRIIPVVAALACSVEPEPEPQPDPVQNTRAAHPRHIPAYLDLDSTPRATLEFLPGWQERQDGAIVRGGQLVVDYDLARMPGCFSSTYNGLPAWDTLAYAWFTPGGQLVSTSVRGAQDPTTGVWSNRLVTLDVPADADGVQLWFENSGETCSTTWDSNLDQNFGFAVLPQAAAAPAWAGNWGSSFDRSCIRVDGVAEPTHVTDWTLTRACMFVDAEVYVPGVTDAGAEHPELIAAQVVTSVDGGAETPAWLTYVGRSGNNYRYRWTMDNADLARETWSTIAYRFRFASDGVTWLTVGQEDGSARTLVRDPPM
jgi:hypothetical protein